MNQMKSAIIRCSIALMAILLLNVGTGRAQDAAAAKASAEENSFNEVAKELDPNGNLYFYIATEQVMAKIDTFLAKLEPTLKKAIEAKAKTPKNKEQGQALVKILHDAYNDFGWSEISGFGVSSIAVEKGFYRNKCFVHHRPGQDQGKIWTMFGKQPHALTGLKFLPATTALAGFYDMDLKMLWQWQEELVKNSDSPTLINQHSQVMQFAKALLSIDQIIESSEGEMGFILSLNEKRMVNFPIAQQVVQFPDPALVLVMKAKDDFLLKFLEQKLQQRQMAVIKEAMGDFQATILQMQLPLPFELRPCFAMVDDYVLISTSATMLREVIDVYSGKKPGLTETPQFKQQARSLATAKANGFGYMSPTFGKTVMTVQQNMMKNSDPVLQELMAEAQSLQGLETAFSFGIFQARPDGLLMVNHASASGAESLITQLTVVPATILAGALMPTLQRARKKATRVNSAGNLKQIGLACLMFSGENNGTFPAPDGEAGLNELAKEGILNVGKVYLHPADKKRQLQPGADKVTEQTCSYLYIGGGFRDDDREATITPLAFEKPDISNNWMNVLFIDGHVEGFEGQFNSAVAVIEFLNKRFQYSPERYKLLMSKARKLDGK